MKVSPRPRQLQRSIRRIGVSLGHSPAPKNSRKALLTVTHSLLASHPSAQMQQCWCRMTGSQLFRNAESRHAEILPVQDFPTQFIERDVQL